MSRKWAIKRYKEDAIIVSQAVGEGALAAWKQGMAIISLPGNISVSSASISAIEETMEQDILYLAITAGIDEKPVVMMNEDGEVITGWYKINVGAQGWEKKYSAMPNYYKLIGEDNSIWVAMRLPEYVGVYERGRDVVQCEEHECQLLERMRA